MVKKITQIAVLMGIFLASWNILANQYQPQGYQNYNYQNPVNHKQRYQPQITSRYTHNSGQRSKSPVVILERSINNVLDFLAQSDSANINQLQAYVNHEISPNFDFDYMSRWVAGKRFVMMNKNQQLVFKTKFTDVFLSTFIEKMTKSRKALPRVSRFLSKRISQNEARASVLLAYSNHTQVKIEFRFMQTAEGWKVVDLKANGISALMYFRNYFAQLMRQNNSK